MGGHVDGRHAFHEAGGEPAKAAIAERGIGLSSAIEVEIDAERRQRLAHRLRAGRDWRRRRASGGRSGTPATGNRRAWPVARRLRLVEAIQRSMMRSRTTWIEAVSQSCWVATAGILADAVGEAFENFGGKHLRVVEVGSGAGVRNHGRLLALSSVSCSCDESRHRRAAHSSQRQVSVKPSVAKRQLQPAATRITRRLLAAEAPWRRS